MTYADRVRDAANPQHALLIVAEGIDLLLEGIRSVQHALRAPTAPPDPWAWKLPKTVPAAYLPAPQPDRAAVLRLAIDQATGDDRRALEAELRLLEDTGASVETGPPAGRSPVTTMVGEIPMVDLPEASPERRVARAAKAVEWRLADGLTMDEADVIECFAKGGAQWLYLYNRALVIDMPTEWKVWMVDDVAQDSERDALEMGRDIFKYDGSTTGHAALDVTMGAINP